MSSGENSFGPLNDGIGTSVNKNPNVLFFLHPTLQILHM